MLIPSTSRRRPPSHHPQDGLGYKVARVLGSLTQAAYYVIRSIFDLSS